MFGLTVLVGLLHFVPADAAGSVVREDPSVFSCSPSRIEPSARRTIVLTKRDANLRELSVRRPGSEASHFLIVAGAPAGMESVMSPDAFASVERLELDADRLKGLEWKDGATSELVFTSAGTYEFLAAPILESDAGGYTCSIAFPGRLAP